MMNELDQQWRDWLQGNLDRKCDPQELADILLRHGFSAAAIGKAMGARAPGRLALQNAAPIDYAALADIPARRLSALSGAAEVESEGAQIFVIENFLDEETCAALVRIIELNLRASTVTVDSNDQSFRTSRTCDLGLLKHNVVREVDLKIARALGVRRAFSESIQAQKYEIGQEFKSHTDYFEPGTREYAQFGRTMGNRTWTFMIYLNDVEAGGGTHFFQIDKIFFPKRGRAVAWNNLYKDGSPNPKTRHAGEPVLAGEKVIITKWFREKGAGRMFY